MIHADAPSKDFTFIYNSEKRYDKGAREVLKSLAGFSIKMIDLAKESFSEKKIKELASKMKVKVEDLIDPNYEHHIGVHNQDIRLVNRKEILSIMARDAKVILTPIIFMGDEVLYQAQFSKLL